MVKVVIKETDETHVYKFETIGEAKAFVLGIEEYGFGSADWTIKISSPCTGVCTMGEEGVCLGCGRTIKEISQYGES